MLYHIYYFKTFFSNLLFLFSSSLLEIEILICLNQSRCEKYSHVNLLLRNNLPQMWNIHNLLRICRNRVNLAWRHRGGALFCSKLWCTRQQRITDTCNSRGGRACARSVTGSSVSLTTCGHELLCAQRFCPRSARRGGRKPRGAREPSKTTLTQAPTDWWVNRLQLQL